MKMVSSYPGTLVLPSGQEIAMGDVVEIDAATAKNAGVVAWIDAGWLTAPKK